MGSNRMLTFLESSEDIGSDGTFKITPGLFDQVVTIHAQFQQTHHMLPCVYILLPNKEEASYRRAFREVKLNFF